MIGHSCVSTNMGVLIPLILIKSQRTTHNSDPVIRQVQHLCLPYPIVPNAHQEVSMEAFDPQTLSASLLAHHYPPVSDTVLGGVIQ